MRIILSRKGLDSATGGIPSPILPDGQLLPLPIPVAAPMGYVIGALSRLNPFFGPPLALVRARLGRPLPLARRDSSWPS